MVYDTRTSRVSDTRKYLLGTQSSKVTNSAWCRLVAREDYGDCASRKTNGRLREDCASEKPVVGEFAKPIEFLSSWIRYHRKHARGFHSFSACDGDDRMENESENLAHACDGIKLKNLKNSRRLRN